MLRLPSVMLLCLVLGTAAPFAFGRRALAHTGKHAAAAAGPGPAPAGMLPSIAATSTGRSLRIIDGAPDATSWAYFTAYIRFTDTYCTGSLVGPAHVLTAAHCFFRVDGTQRTCADVEYVEINGVQYSCSTMFTHHDYQQLAGPKDQSANDIGLIGLTTASNVKPIPLASSGPAPGDVVWAVGFGRTESGENAPSATTRMEGSPDATTRMFTDMVVFGSATCTAPSGPFPDNFCAGMGTITTAKGVSDGGHACHGDSGGPVVNANGELTGVVSWGVRDCLAPYSYHTRVADQLEHINGMIAAWTERAP